MFKQTLIVSLFSLTALFFQLECRAETDLNTKKGSYGEKTSDTLIFLHEKIETRIIEVIPDAIPVWRKQKASKPALILLSQNPFLHAPPEKLSKEVDHLVLYGQIQDFTRSARLSYEQPLLPLQQTLRTCLKNDFFSEVIWILQPALNEDVAIDYDKVKGTLLTSKAITPAEGNTFTTGDETLSGIVEGVPFTVTTLEKMSPTKNAAILHFDLSFFLNGYSNAVKTPLHGIIQRSLQVLAQNKIPSLAATVSLTTGPGLTSLDYRFIADDLSLLIAEPEKLNQPLSDEWKTRQNILYLEHFFQPEETQKLVNKLLEQTPDDPWCHYWKYKLLAKDKKIEEAFATLDKAIKLDAGYADEYLGLSDRASRKGLHRQAAFFLEKFLVIFPDNGLAAVRLAEARLADENWGGALKQIKLLKEKNWSPIYHPAIPGILNDMENFASDQSKNLKASE